MLSLVFIRDEEIHIRYQIEPCTSVVPPWKFIRIGCIFTKLRGLFEILLLTNFFGQDILCERTHHQLRRMNDGPEIRTSVGSPPTILLVPYFSFLGNQDILTSKSTFLQYIKYSEEILVMAQSQESRLPNATRIQLPQVCNLFSTLTKEQFDVF